MIRKNKLLFIHEACVLAPLYNCWVALQINTTVELYKEISREVSTGD